MGIRKKNLTRLLFGLTKIGIFILPLFIYMPSQAEEIRYPVPAYEDKELKRVRQWEKKWVGRKINLTNINGVKNFIPKSLYQLIKDPETWGEIWFEIVPYREIKPTKGDVSFTKKYAGTCRIGSDQSLLNYISGTPFPNPNTGLEIAYNFEHLNLGDNARAFEDVYIIDGKRRETYKMILNTTIMFFSGRRDIPPVPEILYNNKEIYRGSHSEYFEPAKMKGTRVVTIKWKDYTQDYASWRFSSVNRKITRRSTSQRMNTQGRTDLTPDDNNVYDFGIPFMNYKCLGKIDLLLARHQDLNQLKKGHKEGYCLFSGFQRERIHTLVVECTHKNPDYIYGKQIWYVDPETWRILYANKYDHQGNLWRIFELPQYITKSVHSGELISTLGFMSIIDIKRSHATSAFSNFVIGETGEYFHPDYYTPKALQKYGY